MKKLIYIILLLVFTLCLFGCDNDSKGKVILPDVEITEEPSIKAPSYDTSKLLKPDYSWVNSYALSYEYYDNKNGYSEITEGKSENYLQIVDNSAGITTYYEQADGYVLEYILDNKAKTGTTSVQTAGTVKDMYSRFLEISTVDPKFPVYTNVTFIGSDFVAKRSATKYKQVEKAADGSEAKIAYAWIDDELAIATRYEQYDAKTQKLELRWELKSFSKNAKDENVKINLEQYDLQ